MTVAQTSSYRYTGLSSDTKPTDATTGAVFVETDTLTQWEYTGAEWVRTSAPELVLVRKTLTFTGAANLGALASVITLFTVTGRPKVERLTVFCEVDGVSAAAGTLAIGTADTVARFLAATLATNLDASKFVVAGTTALASAADNITAPVDISTDVIGTVATGAITAGRIVVDAHYRADTGTMVGD